MCEINPKHKMFFKLEVFTSHPMSKEEFEKIVLPKVLKVEQELNKDGRIRVHIHDLEEK